MAPSGFRAIMTCLPAHSRRGPLPGNLPSPRTSTGLGLLLLICLATSFGRANADSIFMPYMDYGPLGLLSSVARRDLDNDGNPDLVAGGANGLTVLYGGGLGGVRVAWGCCRVGGWGGPRGGGTLRGGCPASPPWRSGTSMATATSTSW